MIHETGDESSVATQSPSFVTQLMAHGWQTVPPEVNFSSLPPSLSSSCLVSPLLSSLLSLSPPLHFFPPSLSPVHLPEGICLSPSLPLFLAAFV